MISLPLELEVEFSIFQWSAITPQVPESEKRKDRLFLALLWIRIQWIRKKLAS
jgi:hypothetical protein